MDLNLLELARALIAADTVSEKGTAAAVRILLPLYETAGFSTLVQERTQPGGIRQQNVLATASGAPAGGLLLVTHLDTVDPGPLELWTETGGRPYELTQKGDKLYGLGSADTKLDALCKLFAAREFLGKPLKRSLQLLGTYEEEVGAKGARHFVKSGFSKARFVACSEPSELVIIRAHKGYAVVKVAVELPGGSSVSGRLESLQVDGKAAHSSTPHLGVNAIEKALALLDASDAAKQGAWVSLEAGSVANKVPARCTVVRAASGDAGARGASLEVSPDGPARDIRPIARLSRELFGLWKRLAEAQEPRSNPAFSPSECVVNWGVAKLSSHADGTRAELTFDCRLLPGHVPDALIQAFTEQAQEVGEAAGAFSVEVQTDRASPAMELKEPSALLDAARAACRDVGLDDTPQAKPTNTEAGVFAAAGAESIVFGPGRSTGNAHCANEHNLHSQLLKAIEFYRALIHRVCL